MKKQLLSTSALVAAGLVAAGAAQAQTAPAGSPIVVSVGGFMSQFVSYDKMSNSTTGNGSASSFSSTPNVWSQSSDTEIYFNGKTTLANGISVSFRVELEGNTSTDQIDESWMTVEGGFGRFDLGSTDQAAQKMLYNAPAAYITTNGWAGSYPNVNPTGSFGSTAVGKNLSGAVALGDDDNSKISYYTPKFEGFQAGVSYIPQNAQDRSSTGYKGESDGYYNGIFYAANFVRTFGAVDVALYAGGGQWKKPESSAVFNTTTLKDPKMWALGAQFGFAGFKVGGGYARVKDQITITTAATGSVASNFTNDGSVWELGGTYAFGPAKDIT